MRTVLKLALAFFREHPMRIILTSLATIAAACLVVWVVSGYDTLLNSFEDFSDKTMGRYSLSVAPISTFKQYAPGAIPSTAEKFVPSETVEQLRADPAVAAADPMWTQYTVIRVPGAPLPSMGPRPAAGPSSAGAPNAVMAPRLPDIRMLGTNAPASPYPLTSGRWIDPGKSDLLEAAISVDASKRFGAKVGTDVLVGRGDRVCKLRIVGIVNTPVMTDFRGMIAASQLLSPSVGGLYVPMSLAERITGYPARISFVGVSVKPDTNITKFRFGWGPRLSRFSTPSQFQDAHDIEEALDTSASADNLRDQAYTATGVSLLAALFIIFSTLNMGVTERIRQFAVLRAVVLTRLQVGMLIGIESLMLAVIGFLGGIGAGKCLLWISAKASPQVMGMGMSGGTILGANSVMLAAACTFGGALLASVIPAHRATSVRPMDAMAPRSTASGRGVPVVAVIIGILLLFVSPLITFVLPLADKTRYMAYLFIGCTSLAIGFMLLSPAVVALVDRLVSPLLARILGLSPKLLASQITSNLWRTVGTSVALTIGLGLYIAIQVWGYTMLGAFVPGRWAPDALIAFNPQGIATEEAAAVAKFPGVDSNRCLPIVVEQPRFLDDIMRSAERATVIRQDNVVIVGIDPKRGLGGDNPLLKFNWVQGSAEQAVQMLEKGHACVVPDHFLREARMKVGDSFALVPPDNHEHPVRYTIAGAVRLPGWHWQTKPTGFRSRTHRAAALVFADYDSVAKDFSFSKASYVWLDFNATKTNPDRLAAEAQSLYSRTLNHPVAIGNAPNDAPYVRVTPIAAVRKMVQFHAKQWIWAMSELPLITLLVTCLGVLNCILASVRSRRWDLGVLRSIGLTRWALVRLVIAEGLLIGIVACILSLGFGIIAGWCGVGITQYNSFFGGLNPLLTIPWSQISIGLCAVLVLSAVAAIWPAISIGRTQPLTLLQQGRGAF